jgi:hypothetical protein
MQYLSLKEIISTQHVRDIFWNLKHLLDFQRKFLIGLEDVCAMPMEQQLIGRLFVLNVTPYPINHILLTVYVGTRVRSVRAVLRQPSKSKQPRRGPQGSTRSTSIHILDTVLT